MERWPNAYAHQKLAVAVEILATAPGDARARLLQAYAAFNVLRPDHFPTDLRADFGLLIEQLTKRGPLLDADGKTRIGAVENTLRHMKNATAAKIATTLYRLHQQVEAATDPR